MPIEAELVPIICGETVKRIRDVDSIGEHAINAGIVPSVTTTSAASELSHVFCDLHRTSGGGVVFVRSQH